MARSEPRREEVSEAGDGGGPSMKQVAARLREDLRDVTGVELERVSGLRPADGGWQGTVEVVELKRVPPTTDVLATYAVTTDAEGQLASFQRERRYRRSEAGDL